MAKIGVHIEVNGEVVELFKDEGVKLVKKALSYEKVSSNYSDYSKGFTVPASKINNKIFKHYYNPHVLNSFDPFETNTCEIFLNLQIIATGVVRITSVNLENNIPISYSIQFFSDTVNLSEKLKGKTIADIDWGIFNHTLGVTEMAGYLNGNPVVGTGVSDELYYPFVSIRSLLKWDNPNNLTYKKGVSFVSSSTSGTFFDEFRPAAPVSFIITKLFELAGFTLDNKLAIDDTYSKLYIWLNNGEDYISSSVGLQKLTSSLSSSLILGDGIKPFPFENEISNGNGMLENGGFRVSIADTYNYTVNMLVATDLPWEIRRLKNGVAGGWIGMTESPNSYTFNEALAVGDLITFDARLPSGIVTIIDSTTSLSVSSINTFQSKMVPGTFVPKMDAVTFIQGVLDMFNALLYWDNSTQKFIIQNRLDWLNSGNTVDISKYVDTSKKKLRPPTFFNSFNFEFQKGNDLASLTYFDKFLHSHGSTKYHTGNIFGENFTKKLPFTLPQVFLIDSDKADPTAPPQATYNITTTTSVDKAYSRIDPSAMMFTKEDAVRVTGATWKVVDYSGTTATGTNTNDFRIDTATAKTIGFGQTLSGNGSTIREETLFKNYYASFVTEFYNSQVRRYNLSAYMPFAITTQIQPNTTIVINGVDYRIEDITTDTLTGKSVLNLITKT